MATTTIMKPEGSSGTSTNELLISSLNNAITFLANSQEDDGSWPDFIISPTIEGREWTTAYVGWCMNHIPGEQIQRVSPSLHKAKLFLQQSRHPLGGWGFYSQSPVDADSTAYAVLFLSPFNEKQGEDFEQEKEILLGHQNKDGGFGTYQRENLRIYPPESGYYSSTPCVTTSSALALLHLSEDENLPIFRKATNYLLTNQCPSGCWNSFWWEGGIYSSFIITLFLQQVGQGQEQLQTIVQWLKDTQDISGCWQGERMRKGIPFLTALALKTLLLLGEPSSSRPIQTGLNWLLNCQRADGSWNSFSIMKVPPPHQPWRVEEPYTGDIVPGNRRNFVTATVASLLSQVLLYEMNQEKFDRKSRHKHSLSISTDKKKKRQTPVIDQSLEKEIVSIVEQFSGYINALPSELRALMDSMSLRKGHGAGLSHFLPFWLSQEFAKGSLLPQARQMALANRFGQLFCLLQDGVIDRHAGTKPETLILLDAFFFQFIHGYQNLFPASHPFWLYFEEYWQEYLQALAREKERHHRRITPYTHEDFLWLGRKLSPLKICCTGMALLADRDQEIPSISQMLEHFHAGYQLLDDLKDWSEDLKNGDYSFLLTQAQLRIQQQKGNTPLLVEDVERLLWSQGLAAEVLQKAFDFLSQSLQDISHLSLPGLKRWIKEIQQEAQQEMKRTKNCSKKTGKIPQLQIFSQNGHHLVFNVSTSSLYEINEKTALILHKIVQGTWQENSPEDTEILEELQTSEIFSSLAPPKNDANPPLTTFYLNVSPRCNLRCPYCFAGGGDYGGENKPMTPEVGERAVDLLLRESRDKPIVKIVFFGGEPLLNSELIVHLIHYGRRQSTAQGKEMRFIVSTNGTLLNPKMIDLFCREKVAIQISLDGPPQVQNRLRSTIQGEETYQQVIRNIRELQKSGIQRIGIHATILSLEPSPLEILEHLWNLDVGHISMEYFSPTQDRRSIWSDVDVSEIKKFQEDLADYFFSHLREGRIFPYGNLLKPLIRLYRRVRYPSHCGAGIKMAAITPEGTIFPCFRFSEEPALAAGSVFSGLERQKLRPYIDYTVDQQEPCRTCWARYLCGGGCLYNKLLVNGDIRLPNRHECIRRKHQFQITIQLFARIKRELPELVEKIEKDESRSFLPQMEG